ncbi:aminotransferase class I/II-fold pyridoxal phosphate-dependent enzyme [Liquorilactobacillus uvarum]|uniref:aminotransferase class I/II-fold pyridoxal phosphate-dependent enzyme n=1 Tax=Liquorilactobacillus uvarum TaxID=303240 RepID=UPI002889A3CA|nr:aminotransferase class I/II-fold pyridoxal phosphate-dependent enzyme [Liquorilactobacillus uvarum]
MNFQAANRIKKMPVNFFAELDQQIAAVNVKTRNVIDLSKGNPDIPTPNHIVESLKDAVSKKENQKYTPFKGKEGFRKAIQNFYQRQYNAQIDVNREIAIFHGAVVGINAVPQVLLDPGDYVITTDPCYPEYETTVSLAGGRIYKLPLLQTNGYLPDYAQIPNEILAKAKILLLNYLNNPTGAVASASFFASSLFFAREKNLLLVNDFAYASLGFDKAPVSLMSCPGAKENALEIYTLSKTYSMAGWRVGFAVGNASVIEALNKYLAHGHSTVFGAVQDAASTALNSSQESSVEIKEEYQKRRNLLVSGLRKLNWSVEMTAGTFFVWVKIPVEYTSVSFAKLLLEKAQVAVAPGSGFGKYGEGYIRISLVCELEKLEEVLQRLKILKLKEGF